MHGQLLTTVVPLDTGSLLAGRYRILAKVGEGGFGVVYKARDIQLRHRLVAIKQIDLGALSPRQVIEATDSYNREVSMLSRLNHRNLPHIYDHFTDPTHWYVVMQYIEGETLEDYLKRAKGGHLPLKQVRAIGVQLSKVLYYLHAQTPSIIFRDVKPANIMRTRRGRLYLIDFGIARHFNPDKKRDTGPLGSPGYAAPEQYGRAQSTAQTDIYGLGVTLQTLLTGKEPLDDEPATPPTGKPHPASRQLQQLLDQMQVTEAFWRPHNMWDVKKRLLFIQPGNPGLVSIRQKAIPLLIGLFIGSLPYIFLPLLRLFSSPDPNAGAPWFLEPVQFLFFFWPFVFICQCMAALCWLFAAHPRQRLIACGILIMLAFIILALSFSWLPSANSLIH
ncbi:MAG: serine/threonine protein kinase [Chloroflexi bacterium]|nr:MAG: serine/threonine protein kinase [Chloroflexota bacterium]